MKAQARPRRYPAQLEGYGEAASAHNKSLSLHRWANWIAGFSGEFANSAITRFQAGEFHDARPLEPGQAVVLDPFAGVGTTLVEANRLGLSAIGFEINPFAALVCRMKLEAPGIDLRGFRDAVDEYARFMAASGDREPDSSPPAGFKSRIPFYSPSVERKVLLTLDHMEGLPPRLKDMFRVAFASVMVEFSNYTYEPSLGTRPGAGKPLVDDADVGGIVADKLRDMATDIAELQRERATGDCQPVWRVYERSFFEAESCLDAASVDLVVTSPPYMNNYHYVRNSRPQLFWSGLADSPSDLKQLETENFGKFWQTVRGDGPIPLVPRLPQLEREIAEIRQINSDRGVYGGNGWANYVTAYMNDLDRFCQMLSLMLKPGGTAVVVVGNSVVQGREIKVEEYLAEIAELRGLSALSIDRLRDRVGSSIVNTGARQRSKRKSPLYDAAVALQHPA